MTFVDIIHNRPAKQSPNIIYGYDLIHIYKICQWRHKSTRQVSSIIENNVSAYANAE